MRDFRELKVWQKAHKLTLAVYKANAAFPAAEIYGLTSQIRRACTSIPANIAEGNGRGTDPEMVRFLRVAIGSANEVEYYLLLARDLTYLKNGDHGRLAGDLIEVRRMLISFTQKLKARG